MSKISVGGYTIEEVGGKLRITEDSSGDNIELNGNAIDVQTLASTLDADSYDLTNVGNVAATSSDIGESNVTDANIERITTDVRTTTSHARRGRPLYSTTERTLYVDDAAGDDSVATDDITQSNPLKTIQEALHRLPIIIQHQWEIQIADGTYSSQVTLVGPPTMVGGWAFADDQPSLVIQGNESDPTQVDIDCNWFSQNFNTGEVTDLTGVLDSVKFRGAVQNKGGSWSITNTHFTGQNNDRAIGGKGPGSLYVRRCTFEGANYDFLVTKSAGGRVVFESNFVESYPKKYAFKGRNGANIVHYDNSGGSAKPIGVLGKYDFDTGTKGFDQRGRVVPSHPWVTDDWEDGRFNRNRVTGNGNVFRPTWNLNNGQAEVVNGEVQLKGSNTTGGATSRIGTGGNFYFDEVEFDYQFETDPTGTWAAFEWIGGSGDELKFEMVDDDNVRLRKLEGGTNTDLITAGGVTQTNPHTVRITRDDSTSPATWEVILDGASIGTAQDDFWVQPDRVVELQNAADTNINFDNLYIR